MSNLHWYLILFPRLFEAKNHFSRPMQIRYVRQVFRISNLAKLLNLCAVRPLVLCNRGWLFRLDWILPIPVNFHSICPFLSSYFLCCPHLGQKRTFGCYQKDFHSKTSHQSYFHQFMVFLIYFLAVLSQNATHFSFNFCNLLNLDTSHWDSNCGSILFYFPKEPKLRAFLSL